MTYCARQTAHEKEDERISLVRALVKTCKLGKTRTPAKVANSCEKRAKA